MLSCWNQNLQPPAHIQRVTLTQTHVHIHANHLDLILLRLAFAEALIFALDGTRGLGLRAGVRAVDGGGEHSWTFALGSRQF